MRSFVICVILSLFGGAVLLADGSQHMSCYRGTFAHPAVKVPLPLDNITCDASNHMDRGRNSSSTNFSTNDPQMPHNGLVTSCFIFKYPLLEGGMHPGNYKADFYCDYDHLCTSANEGVSFGVTSKGKTGDLFCCNGSLCNVESMLDKMPFPLTCHSGDEGVLKQEICKSQEQCLSQSTFHVTSSNFKKEGDFKYGCDSAGLCSGHKSGECFNVTKNGENEKKYCCCDIDLCNFPPPAEDNITTTAVVPPARMVPMNHGPVKVPTKWLYVGGVVGGVMFTVLMVIIAVIVYRKWKQRQEEQVAEYTYRQLTADLAEDPSSDDYDEALLSDV